MVNHFFDAIVRQGHDAAPFLKVPAGESLTYAEMRRRAAQMAAALASLGVVPGDRVAAQIAKSIEGLILYVGTLQAGAIFLPLNSAYTTAEIDYFLRDAEPSLVVCDPTCRGGIEGITEKVGNVQIETLDHTGQGSLRDKAATMAPRSAPASRAPDDLAAILYTSGTTGRSKGAMLTHANLVSNAEALVEAWRFTDSDCLLHALPIYHTHGLFVACNSVMIAGSSMIFMPKFDAAAMIDAMPDATMMMGVPTFYTRLLDHDGLNRQATSRLRLFVSGSAPLLEATHHAWLERTGHSILERYGMTETNMNCSNPYNGERRPGTVGFPLAGVETRIADLETGYEQPCNTIGMIEIRGPNVFKGYWRNPEKTAADFRADGFFITGDLGKIDADGYVHIVGRTKDLIISGGFNIYPKEVEIEIDQIDGVVESAVIGIAHEDLGEGVVAVLVKRADSALDEGSVKHAIAGRLAKFKQPKRVMFVDELPRNAMGKVQKTTLRATFKDVFAPT